MVLGAGALIRGLAARDLVDEYRLLVFPVILGAGKRMFGDQAAPGRFRLTDSVSLSTGVVALSYGRQS